MIGVLIVAAQIAIVAHAPDSASTCEAIEISVAVSAPGNQVPRLIPPSFAPFDVQFPNPTDAASAVSTDAAPNRRNWLGKARVWFRTSTLGGDSYKFVAKLNATPEQAKAGANLEARSSWVRVWRRCHLTAHVTWPAPANPIGAPAVMPCSRCMFAVMSNSST